jgi:hypothetical protein
MSAVTSKPSTNAFKGLFVTLLIAFLSVPDEFSFKESPMRRIPYRNIASPPKREITLKISINAPSYDKAGGSPPEKSYHITPFPVKVFDQFVTKTNGLGTSA